MAIHACTIIARSRISHARTLFDSLNEHNLGATLSVLVIDDRNSSLTASAEPFERIEISQLGIDETEILTLSALYDADDLTTVLKPWLLLTLISRWNEPIVYLDPHTLVFGPLDEVLQLAREHDLVITPYGTQPIPRDGRKISEDEVLLDGVYNLGFFVVGVAGLRFLGFWIERQRREGRDEFDRRQAIDRRWIDLVPGLFDTQILKDPTYNVAYWNLHYLEVSLDVTSRRFLVNSQPIHTFNFSGYDPQVPEIFSKFQEGRARILLSDAPDLKKLCDLYGERLFEHGYRETSTLPYGYGTLDGGLPYDLFMRRAFTDELLEHETNGLPAPPNPFVDGEEFLRWLNSPIENGTISRYLKQLYESRGDLRKHFPDGDGPGITHLLSWCWDEVAKGGFDARLIPTASVVPVRSNAGDVAHAVRSASDSGGGVQVAGYFRAEMGVGQLGRNTVKAVAASGIPYSTFTDTDVIHRQNLAFQGRQGGGHAVNIVCMNADSLVHFVYRMGSRYFAERYTIGVWAWELEEFPPVFDGSFDYVDEVWAISEFGRDAIGERGLKPVYAMPLTVKAPEKIEDFDLSVLGIRGNYTFLFCFDLLSVFERKNPLGLIEAFTSAFQPDEGPVLVIKALNGEERLADLERVKLRVQGRSDIVVLDSYLDDDQNTGLFNAADCYVSLHRSEGLGLTLAEAMSLGKPVIATAYSGNMSFMDRDTSFLIPFSYGEVPEGCAPYRPGAKWAEPDIAEAAKTMRYVYEHQETAAEVGERARQHMIRNHSPEATSAFVIERYRHAMDVLRERGVNVVQNGNELDGDVDESVVADGQPHAVRKEGTNPPTPPAPLVALAAQPLAYDGPSRLSLLSRLGRRIARKLLSVRDHQQQEVNLALAKGTEHTARLWGELRAELDQLHEAHRNDEQKLRDAEEQIDRLNRIVIDQRSRFESLRLSQRGKASEDPLARPE